jgi:hypothetical protein
VTETIEWIAPDDTVTTLHGGADPYAGTHFVAWNVQGRFSPQARFDEEGIPDADGMRLRAVYYGPGEVTVPVWVQGTSDADLRAKTRALVSTMNPKRGDGRLRVTSPIGDQRELLCRVADGLQGMERIGDTSGAVAQFFPLTFRAHDPFWQDTADTSAGPWEIGTSPGTFFPLFPILLSSSEVFAQANVTNTGDEDAWPVWTITGPGASPRIINNTTEKGFSLATYTLAAMETVTVDTRPTGATRKTVTSSENGDLYRLLDAGSALWPLVPGANSISIELGGAVAGQSSVQMRRRHRYLAA